MTTVRRNRFLSDFSGCSASIGTQAFRKGAGVVRQLLLTVLALGLMSVVFATPGRSQDCQIPGDYHADARPDPVGTATVVQVGILVADVTAIDDVNQTLEGDFILKKIWRDPRLAGLANCRVQRAAVWFPITDVLNSNQVSRTRGEFASDQVSIKPGGLITYHQRFFGRIATYHNLKDFPFDSHRMRIRMASLNYRVDAVRLELDTDFIRLADLLNIPDWTVQRVEAEILEEQIPEFEGDYSVLHLYVITARNGQYYVWKVMVPLMLIVLMSFTVFWINPQRFGPQIGIAATSMLTLIAFQFALTSVLPKLSYFTLMDQLILGSTLLVFGSLIQATAVTVLVDRGKLEKAIKLDHICRWLFPMLFVASWGLILS
jgi:hypothetical protein